MPYSARPLRSAYADLQTEFAEETQPREGQWLEEQLNRVKLIFSKWEHEWPLFRRDTGNIWRYYRHLLRKKHLSDDA
jgi:hypothetical protein